MLSAAAPRLLPLTRGAGAAASQQLALDVLVTLVGGVREGLPAMPAPADPTWRPFQVNPVPERASAMCKPLASDVINIAFNNASDSPNFTDHNQHGFPSSHRAIHLPSVVTRLDVAIAGCSRGSAGGRKASSACRAGRRRCHSICSDSRRTPEPARRAAGVPAGATAPGHTSAGGGPTLACRTL